MARITIDVDPAGPLAGGDLDGERAGAGHRGTGTAGSDERGQADWVTSAQSRFC